MYLDSSTPADPSQDSAEPTIETRPMTITNVDGTASFSAQRTTSDGRSASDYPERQQDEITERSLPEFIATYGNHDVHNAIQNIEHDGQSAQCVLPQRHASHPVPPSGSCYQLAATRDRDAPASIHSAVTVFNATDGPLLDKAARLPDMQSTSAEADNLSRSEVDDLPRPEADSLPRPFRLTQDAGPRFSADQALAQSYLRTMTPFQLAEALAHAHTRGDGTIHTINDTRVPPRRYRVRTPAQPSFAPTSIMPQHRTPQTRANIVAPLFSRNEIDLDHNPWTSRTLSRRNFERGSTLGAAVRPTPNSVTPTKRAHGVVDSPDVEVGRAASPASRYSFSESGLDSFQLPRVTYGDSSTSANTPEPQPMTAADYVSCARSAIRSWTHEVRRAKSLRSKHVAALNELQRRREELDAQLISERGIASDYSAAVDFFASRKNNKNFQQDIDQYREKSVSQNKKVEGLMSVLEQVGRSIKEVEDELDQLSTEPSEIKSEVAYLLASDLFMLEQECRELDAEFHD